MNSLVNYAGSPTDARGTSSLGKDNQTVKLTTHLYLQPTIIQQLPGKG
jgi:hypothetical protein